MAKKNKKSPLTGLEIAVVGMSGRFPGAADIEEFWKNLKNGNETITFFSDKELEDCGIDPILIKYPNYVKAKGFIENIEYFDAAFFGYTPREAHIMDPQIRVMHECAWEALEVAGYDPYTYKGQIGIYAGASFNANWLSYFSNENSDAAFRMTTGSLCYKDALCSLISYKLNLKGPSITIYTACSTSLAAIHQACRSLLTGECQMALAGGVSISLPKKNGYLYEPGMILSPDGHCHVFDADAKGSVFGDGAGLVVLKRLDDAIEDGDYIYAVVKASVVNNDGFRKAGYAAPSTEGQEEVALAALHMAEVEPESITYIEVHSIGASVSDAIEMEALGRIFNTGKKRYCAVGSVKTNVGHLDVASGIAAFIKTTLALTHRMIPPTLNFNTPNPEIDFENSAFYVNTVLSPWENRSGPLRAAINASGIGGSNVHMILEEAPIFVSSEMSRGFHLLILSAREDFALERAIFNLYVFLKKNPRLNLADAVYTLQVGRHAFPKRCAFVCRDNKDAVEILERKDSRHLFTGDHIDRSVIFMFPGQGTEYSYMAWELYRNESIFQKYVNRCARIVKSISGYSLLEAIYPRNLCQGKKHTTGAETDTNATSLDLAHVAQMALFTIEYALACLWIDWGVHPRGMIGHGIGEYAAATIAGVFTLEDALRSLWARCQFMQRIPEGRMMAVVLDEKAVRSFLGRGLWLAAVNTPSLCVVAGTANAILHLEKELTANRISFLHLKTQWAYHSGMLDDILEPYKLVMEHVPLKPPRIPFISSVTGEWITPREAVEPSYWVKQMRRPVLFSKGIQELLEEPNRFLLEVGPGDTLKRLAKEHIQYDEHWDSNQILTSIRRSDDVESELAFLLKTLGQLWVSGVMPDWENFYRGENRHRIQLPTYPFERERYWIEEKKYQHKENKFQENIKESAIPCHSRPVLSVVYTPPVSKIEELITSIWEEVFAIRPIGVFDNFFELGGHSLNATIMSSRIHQRLDVNIPIKEVFYNPTIRQLSRYVEESAREIHPVIEPIEKCQYYYMSSVQKRLYFLWQVDRKSTAYNMPVVRIVEGEINRERCKTVFIKLIQRHESLRTSFHIIDDFPAQVVHDDVMFEIEYNDPGDNLKKTDHIIQEVQGMAFIKEFVRPFDLSHAPLLRVRLVRLSQSQHMLLFDMHHIISDGASMSIFIKDYLALYMGKVLSPLQIQYKDFAHWQAKQNESAALEKQESYWKKEFEGEIPILNLPVDYARNHSSAGNVEGSHLNFEIDRQETMVINKLAAAKGVTLFMLLFSIFNVLLAKLSGQEDIVVGSPIMGRKHADIQQIIGMFINTLALRSFPTAEKSFIHFLSEIKECILQAFDNQDYQFEDLVEKSGVIQDRSRNPLFDVMFVLQNMGAPDIEIPGLKLEPFNFKNWTSKFDITLSASDVNGQLHFSMLYRTRLFKEESIRRFINYFKKVVVSVTQCPELKISEIDIITEEEKEQVLLQFNHSDTDFPRDKLLHQLFEEQANRTPNHVAVVGSTVETLRATSLQISYRELDKKSNRLARLLRQKGILPSAIAAIMVERSIQLVVGLLAILKMGAAYLPIDPVFPGKRIKFMLEDSLPDIIVTQEHLYTYFYAQQNDVLECFSKRNIFMINVGKNDGCEDVSGSCISSERLNIINTPKDPAYVIYTSGTTGKPKGVLVEHHSAVNVVIWFGRKYRLRSGINVLQISDYISDASVNQVFGTLLHGAVVHEISKSLMIDIDELRKYIDTRQVHVINFVPIFLKQLLDCGPKLKSLQNVISGAEVLNDIDKDRIIDKGYELYNQYGPTETTIDALACKCSRRRVNLGTPIANARCYIIDMNTNLSPIGVAGELYIGGEGVSRGYLNNPLLTAEKFVYLPILPGTRLYRSGDLVRWLSGGEIEFLGRIDEQVKIKGFRIELGDIRSQLLATCYIKEAAVVAGNSTDYCANGESEETSEETGEKYICAYIVSDSPVNLVELKNYLSQRLPSFMLPNYFVQLDKIPLTTFGKLDRKSLPKPEDRLDNNYVLPKGEIEEKLVDIWTDILGRKKEIIGRDSNFFELGGHSLKATLLVSRIHKIFAVKLPLQQVFTTPILKELARYIRDASEEDFRAVEPAEKKNYYAISSAQERLYVLYKMDETSTAYSMLAVMILEGILDIERFERAFIKLIQRHESLRTSFLLVGGSPVQKLNDNVEFKITYKDSTVEEQRLMGRIKSGTEGDDPDLFNSFMDIETMIKEFVRPFDLAKAPLLRVELIKIEDNRYMLMVDMHHIISDGISVERLVIEFMAMYGGRELPALKLQYKDYAQWQENMWPQHAENLKKQEEFWKKQFAGEIPILNLPFDYPRPKIFNFEGGQKHFKITREQTQTLQKLALREGITLYMVLLTVVYIFLAKISGQEDIVIGTPIAGRRHADLQHIIGMFVNTMAIRGYPHGRIMIKDFLMEIKQITLEAFENQDYHFEELVDQLAIARDVGRNPLFDVMFTLQNLEIPEIELPQLKLTPYPFERGTSLFDLSIVAKEKKGQLHFIFEYSTQLFKQETIQRFLGYFTQLLVEVSINMETLISQLEFLSPEEKQQLLFLFNKTDFPYPENISIHGLLAQQSEKIPYSIVLIGKSEMKGENMVHISYKELNEGADRIVRILVSHGVKSEMVVGIKAKRSIETVVGIFGIMKAGAVYLPLNPEFPQERIDYMLRDSGAELLAVANELEGKKVRRWEGEKGSSNLAYIIYTSGSTGNPKGVMVEHRSVVNRLYWIQQHYQLGKKDVVMQKTPFIFDVSICELFRCIPGGGKVFLLPGSEEKEPGFMIETTMKHQVTTIDFTPPILDIFLDYVRSQGNAGKVASLRFVFVGVEIVSSELVKKFNELLFETNATQLINAYGPTETTVDVTAFNCSLEEFQDSVPIGKPISNTQIYILDNYGNVQPIGVVGELYIGGDCVSRGYLNNPELTAEKFIKIKNRSYRSNRSYKTYILYKSGDQARWLPDGNIEFLGRMDTQVKIRGIRIELKEVETWLLKHKQVKGVTVTARKDHQGAAYLCAYIVPAQKTDATSGDIADVIKNELKMYLSNNLPDYMIPSRFVIIKEIPLTPTGKIDRRALPEPSPLQKVERGLYVPITIKEKILLNVWSEVLGIQNPGPQDNFFEFGGDSIKAIQLASRLHDRGFVLNLVDIFLYPRILELAAHIYQANKFTRKDERGGLELDDIAEEDLLTIKRKIETMDWPGDFS